MAARCPHAVFRDVLGLSAVADLLDFVNDRRDDFAPAPIRTRGSGFDRMDRERRDCFLLRGVGPVRPAFEAAIRDIAPRALARLGLTEAAMEPREFEISAHCDGGHFTAHVDTTDNAASVRIVSCVYYFARTPRPFAGGELRLYGFPDPFHASAEVPIVDVVPETDVLVAFPSWLTHEVRPVAVPSGAWLDGRFAINCWIHRAAVST